MQILPYVLDSESIIVVIPRHTHTYIYIFLSAYSLLPILFPSSAQVHLTRQHETNSRHTLIEYNMPMYSTSQVNQTILTYLPIPNKGANFCMYYNSTFARPCQAPPYPAFFFFFFFLFPSFLFAPFSSATRCPLYVQYLLQIASRCTYHGMPEWEAKVHTLHRSSTTCTHTDIHTNMYISHTVTRVVHTPHLEHVADLSSFFFSSQPDYLPDYNTYLLYVEGCIRKHLPRRGTLETLVLLFIQGQIKP